MVEKKPSYRGEAKKKADVSQGPLLSNDVKNVISQRSPDPDNFIIENFFLNLSYWCLLSAEMCPGPLQ